MAEERPVLNAHGAKRLPSVEVDGYNLEIKDEDGFVGDKASRGAFHDILDKWREPLRKLGADPLSMTLAEFDAMIQRELAENARLIKAAGIKAN